jgi:hypothetical protein
MPTDFGGAVVAFMNPGGIRSDLTFAASAGGELPGQITYNEVFTVQPFNNVMTVKTTRWRRPVRRRSRLRAPTPRRGSSPA